MSQNNNDIVLLSAFRTPIGRFQGIFRDTSATDLGAAAIRAAVAEAAIDPQMVDECIMGNVISAGLGQAPARQAGLRAGLPDSVGGLTVNKVCGSGLKAVALARALIAAGDARMVVAGGMENMTRAPYLLPQARAGYRLGNGELVDAVVHDGLWCAVENHHMGNSAEWIARDRHVSREAQDAFALESHRRAVAAQDTGAFAGEIAPVTVAAGRGATTLVEADETPRRDTSPEALARLRPAFDPQGSVTAGNAPGLSDGAAAVLVTNAATAAELGRKPLARVLGFAQAGVAPLELFTAPVFAVQALMQRTGTSIDDYDLFEINEAFAAQAVANMRELGIDHERLNVNGGAVALGHPIGASGARVLVTLAHALRRRGGGRGIAALCLGGGEAVAMAIEVAA
ncbi:MAG TPA: thiolase family protein [Roseiflexaceae bacterium]|nr:thiolase family protein [Roseiflexaceae bacterium]